MGKDLRNLSEEEFKEVYEHLKNRTEDFTKINKELLKENPQYLYVIRLVAGLSQLDLGKMLNSYSPPLGKQWVKHFESGRQGFVHSKNFDKCIKILNRLFQSRQILDFDNILKFFIRSQRAIKKWRYEYPEPKYKLKRISEMEEKDFIKYFNTLSKETDNFTKFDSMILIRTPVFLTILRIILDFSLCDFCNLLNVQTRNIRKYESFEERMMPETAERFMKVIENEFERKKIRGNVNLDNALKTFQRLTPFKNIELEIKKQLLQQNTDFCIHSWLNTIRKTINVDFVIPNPEKPKIVVEVTNVSKVRRKDIIHRVAYLDHRFQLIKLKYKNIFTVLVIECHDSYENLVKRILERETVNTDFYLINRSKNFIDLINSINVK